MSSNAPQRARARADLFVGQLRYALMPYPGAIQASVAASLLVNFAARHAPRFREVIGDLVDLVSAEDDATRPVRIVTRTYTEDELAAIANDGAQARLIACLARGSIVDMEATAAAMSALVGPEAAAMMLLRRSLSALTRTVPAAALRAAAACTDETEVLRPGSFVVLVPRMSEAETGAAAAAVRRFWRGAAGKDWTRGGFSALVGSAVISAAYGLGLTPSALVRAMRDSLSLREVVGDREMAAAWATMPEGPADRVEGIVEDVRSLACILVGAARGTNGEKLDEGPAADRMILALAGIVPGSLRGFVGRLVTLVARRRHELPDRISPDSVLMLVGPAPAVVVAGA
jgi:hypothetical protein